MRGIGTIHTTFYISESIKLFEYQQSTHRRYLFIRTRTYLIVGKRIKSDLYARRHIINISVGRMKILTDLHNIVRRDRP